MEIYRPAKGMGLYRLLGALLLYGILIVLTVIFVNSYVVSSLLKVFLILFIIYHLYYILLFSTLKYTIDDKYIYITNFFRKIKVSIAEIEAYQVCSGNINGIRLSGFCTNDFSLGRSFIKNIGSANMFVTTSKNIFYFKCGETNYAISPAAFSEFKDMLSAKGIPNSEWDYTWNSGTGLHKDKSFMMPFFIATIINIVLTLNPFVLYLMDKLPATMPLSFDASFMPLEFGRGKQFAFSQMVYGALNMAIQFCMYYAAHFYAKYDRRSVNKFIYVSLSISVAFLLIQFRILHTFR
jgi:hypothetical protein